MKKILLFSILVILFSLKSYSQSSIYDYTVKDINNEDFRFADLEGKKILIVNTASECGLTPQYSELQELYEQHGGDNFVIVGFPSNDFMNQEPGSNEEIKAFCTRNYGVTFPMMFKISVKGENMAPIYEWLTRKELNNKEDSKVKWNFQKYLIDENGNLVAVFPPKTKPLSDEIVNKID